MADRRAGVENGFDEPLAGKFLADFTEVRTEIHPLARDAVAGVAGGPGKRGFTFFVVPRHFQQPGQGGEMVGPNRHRHGQILGGIIAQPLIRTAGQCESGPRLQDLVEPAFPRGFEQFPSSGGGHRQRIDEISFQLCRTILTREPGHQDRGRSPVPHFAEGGNKRPRLGDFLG